jgi:siroheme synthase-like protein
MSTLKNTLFPVFLKADAMHFLVVGGGNIALEKVNALLTNSPAARITLVAPWVNETIKQLSTQFHLNIIQREFEAKDLSGIDVLIVAVNDKRISQWIKSIAKEKKVLTNVADTPDLCDFYLSSIVQKGNLKVAISTNGKSPTMAKRIKEFLNEALPEEIDELVEHLHVLRNQMKGDFKEKVIALNKITATLASENINHEKTNASFD